MDVPWVEKYRPQSIEKIILSSENTKIIQTIMETDYMPNMLLYGPPGTGKTTTVIQIIQHYQTKHDEAKKGLMIHLNASDERGVEVIRSQINAFVTSKTFFGKGHKFVVLDEVDYMTKNAQQALTYVLYEHKVGVRFFLICNYISKIDETLQSYFMKMNFNHLPKQAIVRFLKWIASEEDLVMVDDHLDDVCNLFQSDVRSMINYLQLNKEGKKLKAVMNAEVWKKLYLMAKAGENINSIVAEVDKVSALFNTDSVTLVKDFLNYSVVHFDDFPIDRLSVFSNAMHGNASPDILVTYVFLKLLQLFHS